MENVNMLRLELSTIDNMLSDFNSIIESYINILEPSPPQQVPPAMQAQKDANDAD